MPFRDGPTHLRDILQAIGHVEPFVASMTPTEYMADTKTKSAVERPLQIVSEAADRLGADVSLLNPEHDWRGLARMGDLLRHAYHRVDDALVWQTIQADLPELKLDVLRALAIL